MSEPDFEAIQARMMESFTVELAEHLEALRKSLGRLKERGELSSTGWEDVLRRLHSLKGTARMINLPPLEKVAHSMETLLLKISQSEVNLAEGESDLIGLVLDGMEDWYGAHRKGSLEPSMEPMLDILNHLAGGPARPASEEYREAVAPAIVEDPDPPSVQGGSVVRLHAENLDRMLRTSSGLLSESLRQQDLLHEMARIRSAWTHLQNTWETLRPSSRELHDEESRPVWNPVHVEELERHFNGMSRLLRKAQTSQRDSATRLNELGLRLQGEIRQANMVPAADMFSGFGPMVRDLATAQGKQVKFEAHGWEIEAERRVFQSLLDPLVHTLRNAVHHGLGTPAERGARGKAPRGKIWLRLQVLAGQLELEVGDDGRGIDVVGIARQAERLGLGHAQDLLEQGQEKLLGLAFHPLLSTASEVSDVAGRGMGLSVVSETVNRLGGEISASSSPAGTVIKMTVPLALSSMSALIVETGGQKFALPTATMERLVNIKASDLGILQGRPTLRMTDGETVPVMPLSALLNLPSPVLQEGPVAVMRVRGQRIAVGLEKVIDHREVVVQSLNLPRATPPTLAGGCILPGGGLALVLSPAALLSTPSLHTSVPVIPSAPEATPAATAASHARKRSILIVDDSFTTRGLQKGILETHGFNVGVAGDGVEALERLASGQFDLVITDIQMPRMDGFGLLAALKESPVLKNLPVIMLSSLDRPEEIGKGLELGADAYVIKAQFDQKHLLELIRQLL